MKREGGAVIGMRLSGAIWDDSVGYFINVASKFLHRWGFGVGSVALIANLYDAAIPHVPPCCLH